MNAEGAADAEGAAYAPLDPPYAPVSYAPNVEVGAGSDSYALPPAGTLPAGEGAAGCSKGLRKSSPPLAPPRAPGSANGFAAPFSSNGLSAIVTCRATPRRPLAAVHERLEKIKPRRRATASVGVRAKTPWLSRGLRSRRRVYEDGRVGGVDRVTRASTDVWGLALEIVRNARACVGKGLTCHARLLGPRTAISNERSPVDSWSLSTTCRAAFKSSRAGAAVHRTHPPRDHG